MLIIGLLGALLASGSAMAQQAIATQPDLFLYKKISNQKPQIGDVVSVTMVVGNSGTAAATGVVVQDSLLAGGAEYVSQTIRRGGGSVSFQTTAGTWMPGTIATGDSAVVVLTFRVLGQGVYFNTAEVTAMQGEDLDSKVNNHDRLEDDYAATCFSVPIYWYQGDEYQVTIPRGFTNTQWMRNGQAVTAATPAAQAAVRGDTLIIRSPGTYTFTTTLSTCPAGGCCPIEVVQGPCGSLGNFVWLDTNYNGSQDAGEPGVANVRVRLYTQNADTLLAETTTNASGFYSFTCLPTGNYRVQFQKPDGTVLTTFRSPTTSSDKDSDGQESTGGAFSPVIPINVAYPETDKRRNNPDIDLGLAPFGSIGNFVWQDGNANGFQDTGEAGIPNVRVNLYVASDTATIIKSVLTNASGNYKFDSLQSGSYVVRFMLPAGNRFTTANAGTAADDERDSDAGQYGFTQTVVIDASQPFNSLARNNMTVDAGIRPACTTPVGPVASNTTACEGQTALLNATSAGNTLRWYTTATGGTPFATVSSGTSVSVTASATTTYYVEAVTAENCLSPRTPVTLTVNPRPVVEASASSVQVCTGTSFTLSAAVSKVPAAGLSYVWRGPNGYFSTEANPSVPATALTASGVYSVTVTSAGQCSGTASVSVTVKACECTVNPPLITSSITHTCPGDAVSLQASNCNGTVIWSTGQTGSQITVSPTDTTTYTATCREATCTSKNSNAITLFVVDPATPTVTAETNTVCPGGQVTLTATGCAGRVIWSTGATGTSITVTPVGTTSYYANCRVANCISNPSQPVTIYVGSTLTPQVVASASSLCVGESTTLSVINCAGTPVWSTGATTESIVVSPTQTTRYSVICKTGACVSPSSPVYEIVVNQPVSPVVTASSTTICAGGSVALTATGCQGTVLWSSGQTGATVTVTPTANVSYTAYCKIGTCTSEASAPVSILIANPAAPLIKTTKTLLCAGEDVTLTAEGCTGTVVWSNGLTGVSITDRPGATTNYSARCQVGACLSPASNTISVNVSNGAETKPVLTVSKSTICKGENVVLSATGCTSGTLIWSTGATGASITVTPTATTEYYVACKVGAACNSQPAKATVTVNTPPTPGISGATDRLCPGESTVLTVTNCSGTPLWSTGETTSSITVTPTATTSYTVVCRKDQCSSDPSGVYLLTVEKPVAPVITASLTEFETGQPVSLTATGCGTGQVVWSTGETGSIITVSPATTTTYWAQCRVGTNCLSEKTTITLKKKGTCEVVAPVVTASAPDVCYGGSVTLTATGCTQGTVIWSNKMTGSSITVTNLVSTTQFTAVCQRDPQCTSPASTPVSVQVVYINAPTVVSSKPVICPGDTTTLTALGCPGQIIWSTGATTNSIVVKPGATTDYWAKCKVGTCESTRSPLNTVRVVTPTPPTISASSTNLCFGEAVTLTATACQEGYVIWSNGLVGSSITLSPAVSTTLTAICCTSDNCKSGVSNPVVLTVGAKPRKPVTVDKINTCPFLTVDLTTAVTGSPATGSTYEFRTGNTPTSPLVANPNAVGAGVYYVFERSANGCYGPPAVINVQITDCNSPLCTTNPASVTAGANVTLCDSKEYRLNGQIGGSATSAVWSTSGTGTFDNALLLNALYRASAEDIKAGFVTLTLTTNDPDGNGPCPAAKATVRLTFKGLEVTPTVLVQGNTVLCNGDSVVLKAMPAGYRYRWNTNATTQSIVVKAGGTYSVTLLNNEGCTSVTSEAVSVTVNSPILPPQVPMMARNACPATTVSLISLIESQPRHPGSTFEFRAGSSVVSPVVMRPDSVGQGTYYIFERSAAGCYSAGMPVEVSVFNCATDTCRSDLYITKTVDKKYPRIGDVVTYTIKLGNKGACAATHVDFRDILPDGLELVSNGNLAVDYLGHLTMWVTPLQAGEEREYFYKARVIKRTPITNDVRITYLDQVDPDTTNNYASITIQDTTAMRPVFVGLAKKALGVTKQADGTYAFRYAFNLKNYSATDARKVQITDNLTAVFAPNVVTEAKLEASNTHLKFNSAYSGTVNTTQMLDTTSILKAGDSESFLLTARVRLVNEADSLKTFYNEATLTAVLNGATVWDNSTNGDTPDPDNDGNPTNNSTPTPIRIYAPAPTSQLGVALAVTGSEKQPDDSYLVTYKITLKNYGTTRLTELELSDSLAKAITAPAEFTVVSAPKVQRGSTLVPNTAYNGHTNTVIVLPSSSLEGGEMDSVLIQVRIRPNGLTGVILNQIVGVAKGDTAVKDLSNNGLDPEPAGSQKTPVRFDLPSTILGVAKSVGQPVNLGNGVYEVPYTILLTNLGTVDMTQVQVTDDLAKTFESKGALILSNKIEVTAQSGLVVDTTYTGRGLLTKLLDTRSTLAKGETRTLSFKVRVDVRNADDTQFNNLAVAQAFGAGNVMVQDTSVTGSNSDPDNDLDPRNNSAPTTITLAKPANTTPSMGLALAVKDTVRQADGSYRVTYQVIVKNYSSLDLLNVQLQDSLAKHVFNATTGASYTVVGAPTVRLGSTLVPNPAFDGNANPELLVNSSRLAANTQDTLVVTVLVRTDGRTTPYLNTVYGQGLAGTTMLRDVSTDGVQPDPNGNGDPTEATEGVATPLILPRVEEDVFIPQGFSPNGDGTNDVFVIRHPVGLTVSLEVFNRWGHAVYRKDDYQNDWDGTANTGVRVGSTANGLPDGTYYYIVRLSDGRRFVRYMTINR